MKKTKNKNKKNKKKRYFKMMFAQGLYTNADYKFLDRLQVCPFKIHVHNEGECWHDLETCMENWYFPIKNVIPMLQNIPPGFTSFMQRKIDDMRREIDLCKVQYKEQSIVYKLYAKHRFLKLFELYFRVKHELETAKEITRLIHRRSHVDAMKELICVRPKLKKKGGKEKKE
jgi:hypothetical protein